MPPLPARWFCRRSIVTWLWECRTSSCQTSHRAWSRRQMLSEPLLSLGQFRVEALPRYNHYIPTYLHYITLYTLHYIIHYNTIHCNTSQYITLRNVTRRDTTWHDMTWHYITYIHTYIHCKIKNISHTHIYVYIYMYTFIYICISYTQYICHYISLYRCNLSIFRLVSRRSSWSTAWAASPRPWS